MIGDERTAIDAEMVTRVTSGQTPDAENLKKISQGNNYDDIAVNKQQQSIAICHWGDEYVSVPPHRIMTRAQKMSDTFDLVIGHHPHVIQGVKSFENTKVYFSLGNFYLKGFNYKNGALHVFPQECYLGILVSYDTKERISEAYGCRYDEKKKEVLLSNEATNHFVARSEEIKCDSKTAHIRWEKSYYEYLKFRRNCLLYTSPSPRDRTRSRMPSSA